MRYPFVGILAAIVLIEAEGASALNSFGIYSDSQGTSCLVSDAAPGPITLYVLHTTDHATASQFRVVTDSGFTGIFMSHQVASGFLDLGTPTTDYSVSYAGCVVGTFLVVTIVFQGYGTSAACSHIDIGAAPTSAIPGEIMVIHCDLDPPVVGTSLGPAVVNYDGACPARCIVAVETSTWGKVKALYRDDR